MIRLTIDGQEVTVPEGTMIADAAARLGIEIPVYCYHEALGPLGACRMCLVQVEKMPKLATACTTAVQEGMVVHTHGPQVDKGRQGMLEFLLINHPLDCPVCDKGGECFLQDYTFEYGAPKGRFLEPKIQKVKDGPINEFVLVDQERCVLCQRCVRFMGEYVGEPQLLLEGRGVETVVTTVDHQPATSQFTGNVIDLCPVGALLSKPYHYKARPWNIERQESVCPHCPVGCTMLVTGRDGRIVRTEGRPVPDREWGWLCDRGRFGYDYTYHASRLTTSSLRGVSQAAAYTTREVGQWLKEVVTQGGGDRTGWIIGGSHTVEEARELWHFAHEIVGSPNLAVSRNVPGYLPRPLNGTFDDVKQADTVIYLGVDPYEAVPVVHLKLRERRRHFPTLNIVGIGARRLTRETLPGEDILVAPGSEAWVLAEVLRLKHPDHPAVARLTAGRHLASGQLASEVAERLADLLDKSAHLVFLWDGLHPELESVLQAIQSIRTAPTKVLPTWGPSNWRGFEAAGFPARFEALTRVLQKARDGELDLLVLWGADLWNEYPDQALVQDALSRVRYVVYEGVVPPGGGDLIDAWLPGATWGEVTGTYVNMEARLQTATASVNPPGQARPTKTYITAFTRTLGHVFPGVEDFDPYDPEGGDLLPMTTASEEWEPLSEPPVGSEKPWLITGQWVFEGGYPSDILQHRRPEYPARISPEDAEKWGIGETGRLQLTRDGKQLAVRVTVDARMPEGVIWIPLGVPDMPVNFIGTGPVDVTSLEEVHSA